MLTKKEQSWLVVMGGVYLLSKGIEKSWEKTPNHIRNATKALAGMGAVKLAMSYASGKGGYLDISKILDIGKVLDIGKIGKAVKSLGKILSQLHDKLGWLGKAAVALGSAFFLYKGYVERGAKGAAYGALGGAGIGWAVGGPIGAAIGAIAGGIFGGIFGKKKAKRPAPRHIAYAYFQAAMNEAESLTEALATAVEGMAKGLQDRYMRAAHEIAGTIDEYQTIQESLNKALEDSVFTIKEMGQFLKELIEFNKAAEGGKAFEKAGKLAGYGAMALQTLNEIAKQYASEVIRGTLAGMFDDILWRMGEGMDVDALVADYRENLLQVLSDFYGDTKWAEFLQTILEGFDLEDIIKGTAIEELKAQLGQDPEIDAMIRSTIASLKRMRDEYLAALMAEIEKLIEGINAQVAEITAIFGAEPIDWGKLVQMFQAFKDSIVEALSKMVEGGLPSDIAARILGFDIQDILTGDFMSFIQSLIDQYAIGEEAEGILDAIEALAGTIKGVIQKYSERLKELARSRYEELTRISTLMDKLTYRGDIPFEKTWERLVDRAARLLYIIDTTAKGSEESLQAISEYISTISEGLDLALQRYQQLKQAQKAFIDEIDDLIASLDKTKAFETEFDPATLIEKYRSSIEALKKQWGEATDIEKKAEIAEEIKKKYMEMLDIAEEWRRRGGAGSAETWAAVIDEVTEGLKQLRDTMNEAYQDEIDVMEQYLSDIRTALETAQTLATDYYDTAIAEVKKVLDALNAIEHGAADAYAYYEAWTKDFSDVVSGYVADEGARDERRRKAEERRKRAEEAADDFYDYAKRSYDDIIDAVRKGTEANVAAIAEAVEDYLDALAKATQAFLDALAAAAAAIGEEMARAVEEANQAISDAVAGAMGNIADAVAHAQEDIAGAVEDAISELGDLVEASTQLINDAYNAGAKAIEDSVRQNKESITNAVASGTGNIADMVEAMSRGADENTARLVNTIGTVGQEIIISGGEFSKTIVDIIGDTSQAILAMLKFGNIALVETVAGSARSIIMAEGTFNTALTKVIGTSATNIVETTGISAKQINKVIEASARGIVDMISTASGSLGAYLGEDVFGNFVSQVYGPTNTALVDEIGLAAEGIISKLQDVWDQEYAMWVGATDWLEEQKSAIMRAAHDLLPQISTYTRHSMNILGHIFNEIHTLRTGMGYQHGTAYVPKTGLALVHQGEKIIPAGEIEDRQRKTLGNNKYGNIIVVQGNGTATRGTERDLTAEVRRILRKEGLI
jgi:gas vesicle protein